MTTRSRSKAKTINQERSSSIRSKRPLSPESTSSKKSTKKPKATIMSDNHFEILTQLISSSSSNIESKIGEAQSILENKLTNLEKKVEEEVASIKENRLAIFRLKSSVTLNT